MSKPDPSASPLAPAVVAEELEEELELDPGTKVAAMGAIDVTCGEIRGELSPDASLGEGVVIVLVTPTPTPPTLTVGDDAGDDDEGEDEDNEEDTVVRVGVGAAELEDEEAALLGVELVGVRPGLVY